MLGDNGFKRSFLAERRGVLRAKQVEVSLGLGFLQPLRIDQTTKLTDFFGDATNPLADGFEFESKLSALPAEGFHLRGSVADFALQAPSLAVRSRKAFFGLRQLITQPRSRRHDVENGDARIFLLAFNFSQAFGGRGSFLLAAI